MLKFKKYGMFYIALVITTFCNLAFAEPISSKIEHLGDLKNLTVPDIKVRDKNGFLDIQADFVNSSANNQKVYYRFKWLDSEGFEVWAEEQWKLITMIGKQKVAVKGEAPTSQAKDFKIELQTP